MAENQLIIGLKRQYARTLGFIDRGEDRAEDLVHLAAVIRMFQPSIDLSAIKPMRTLRPDREDWIRDALTILRKRGEPMSAGELAQAVLRARGVPVKRATQQHCECSLHAVLWRLEGRGVVRVSDEPKRWRVAD
jgi:hypothetical protein